MASYDNYLSLKGWAADFTPSLEERCYFDGEFAEFDFKGKKLLEIGFGNGALLGYAMQKGAEVIGVELIPDLIESAKRKDIIAYHVDQIEGLSLEVDYIIAFDVFEHLDESETYEMLKHIERLLASSGILILRFPNGSSPFGRIYQHGDLTHKQTVTPHKIRQYIHDMALRVESYRDPYKGMPTGLSLKGRLRFWVYSKIRQLVFWIFTDVVGLGKIPLDPNCIVILKKTI
jgi:2-polyprenyl-3-methyl-5-hydroxy-6-metoxy-1,4-benzoquinol methylase